MIEENLGLMLGVHVNYLFISIIKNKEETFAKSFENKFLSFRYTSRIIDCACLLRCYNMIEIKGTRLEYSDISFQNLLYTFKILRSKY